MPVTYVSDGMAPCARASEYALAACESSKALHDIIYGTFWCAAGVCGKRITSRDQEISRTKNGRTPITRSDRKPPTHICQINLRTLNNPNVETRALTLDLSKKARPRQDNCQGTT